jgi:predicted ester cyclase
MTTQTDVKRVAEQIDAFWNERQFDLAGEFVATDFVGHMIGDEDLHGRAAYRAWGEEVEEMFPDFEITFEPTFVADDVHCGRWTLRGTHEGDLPSLGIEPTGASVEFSGLFINRVADGHLVEMWHQIDYRTLMEQVGARGATE